MTAFPDAIASLHPPCTGPYTMSFLKLTTLLIVLGNFQRGHSDTTVASATTNFVNSPNETTVDGTTIKYQANSTDSNGVTTKMATQNVMTTKASTPNTEGSPVILGKGVKVFAKGANMSMVCVYNSSSMLADSDLEKLKFFDKSGIEFSGNRNFMQSHRMITSQIIETTLTKESLDRPDAGTYQCIFDNQNADKFIVSVAIVEFTTMADEYNMTAGDKQTNSLKCSYQVEKEDSVNWDKQELMWTRDDQSAESVSVRHKVNGTTLVIENTEWTDIGPYTCSVKLTWGGVGSPSSKTVSTMVPLRGAPKIGKMDTSKNVVQEDDLEIKCDVTGYPYPSVAWKKDGLPLTPNKRITLSKAEGKYENAILSINNLEFEDKGEYTCNATNIVNPSGKTATIVIRVKDKLAALWPFLGIVAEVIVLCVIIFIYEKKRSREMEDEADGGDDVVNSDDHKGKDVRQRNVRT